MTFSDDMLQLEFNGGRRRVTCISAGVAWPPPEILDIMGFKMRRESMSSLTDEQRNEMTHVLRGAVYIPFEGTPS